MSDAEPRADNEPPTGNNQSGSVTRVDLRTLHRGDTARVTTENRTLDPTSVIAVWPYAQLDFCPDRHNGDLQIRESRKKDMTVEQPEWEVIRRPINRGMRVTFATTDGGRYAAVNWAGTDAPPLLYLLVVDSEDPDGRRWDRLDELDHVERYGDVDPERSPEWHGRRPSEDIPPWRQEHLATPEFPDHERV